MTSFPTILSAAVPSRRDRRPPDVLDMSPDELVAFFEGIGQQPYRARQLLSWVYAKGETQFGCMTDLPQGLRETLARRLRIGGGCVEDVARSRRGGTAKYLFRLDDGGAVEAVSMREGRRHMVCLSSQVGCAMDCAFCATAAMGLTRNLSCGEILFQALTISRAEGRITNVLFMGMGEPLLNLSNVLKAVDALAAPDRFELSARRITLSTCGIVPGIERLGRSSVSVRLALSLNSPFQKQRVELMPVARKYPLRQVLAACARYCEATGRRVTLEYVLLRGVNTGRAAARELAHIAMRLGANVNLIEFNRRDGLPFCCPLTRETLRFRKWLEENGVNVTIRFRRGREIAAGCGQLAGRVAK